MSDCAPGRRHQLRYALRVPATRFTGPYQWLAIGLLVTLHAILPTAQGQTRTQRALDQQSRRDAIEAIPFDQLDEQAHAKLWSVVSRPSLYRQMPAAVIPADPELYVFLVRHPEVIVNMWDLMGITKVTINRNADYVFDASDGAGTDSRVELIYGDQNLHVMYADGTYEGPLLKNEIRGRCVLVLRSEYSQDREKNTFVTSRLDVFLQIDNVGAELIARTLHPLVGSTADQNFVESVKFVGQVTQAAETRPQRLQQLSQRLTKVNAPVRQQFQAVAALANQRAHQRRVEQTTGTVSGQPPASRTSAVSRVYSVNDRDKPATVPAAGVTTLR